MWINRIWEYMYLCISPHTWHSRDTRLLKLLTMYPIFTRECVGSLWVQGIAGDRIVLLSTHCRRRRQDEERPARHLTSNVDSTTNPVAAEGVMTVPTHTCNQQQGTNGKWIWRLLTSHLDDPYCQGSILTVACQELTWYHYSGFPRVLNYLSYFWTWALRYWKHTCT